MADITIGNLTQRQLEDFLQAERDVEAGRSGMGPQQFSEALAGFATALLKEEMDPQQYNIALGKFVEGLALFGQRRDDLKQIERDGARVRAAARCGWFDDLDEEAVNDMAPWEVDQLGTAVLDRCNEAVTVPKN